MRFSPSTPSDYGCGGDCGCGPCSQARDNYGGIDLSCTGLSCTKKLLLVTAVVGGVYYWMERRNKGLPLLPAGWM